MTVSAAAWTAYSETVLYLATPLGTVRIRPAPIGTCQGEFPDVPGRLLHVITAFNPGGKISTATRNWAAHARLHSQLKRRNLHSWRAAGGDSAWMHVEPSVAVLGLDRAAAVALGAQFGQDAVFEISVTARHVVSCNRTAVHTTGWLLDVLDGDHIESSRPFDRPKAHGVELRGRAPDGDPQQGRAEPEVPLMTATSEPMRTIVARAPGDSSELSDRPSPPYPEDWLAPDGYLSTVGCRDGALMSVVVGGAKAVVRGDGSGLVWVDGLGGASEKGYQITEAMAALAQAGAFDWDEDQEFESGAWDAGEVAAIVAPWYDLDGGGGEFAVDGIEMWSDGHGRADLAHPNADAEPLALESIYWDLGPGGGSPGNSDDGWVFLVRVGPRYVVYQCQGGETITDDLDAHCDQEARTLFRRGFADPE